MQTSTKHNVLECLYVYNTSSMIRRKELMKYDSLHVDELGKEHRASTCFNPLNLFT